MTRQLCPLKVTDSKFLGTNICEDLPPAPAGASQRQQSGRFCSRLFIFLLLSFTGAGKALKLVEHKVSQHVWVQKLTRTLPTPVKNMARLGGCVWESPAQLLSVPLHLN